MADGDTNRPASAGSPWDETTDTADAAASSSHFSSSPTSYSAPQANDTVQTGVTGTTGREENPFSFRHFLRRAQNPPAPAIHNDQPAVRSEEEHEARRFGGARPKTTNPRRQRQGQGAELKSPCGLPDFVQDHLDLRESSDSPSNRFSESRQASTDLPSPLDLPRSQSPIHAAGAMPIPLDLANLASSNIEDHCTLDLANLNASSRPEINAEERDQAPQLRQPPEINNNENVNNLSQLPDFLSDGPMLQQSGRQQQQQETAAEEPWDEGHGGQSHVASEGEENGRLRQQLEVALANERSAQARIERLETALADHRRRDMDDASTLEKALEQVEDNLKLMQQRAQQAEVQVSQLRKENRRLQEEVSCLQETVRSLRCGDEAGAASSQTGYNHPTPGLSRTAHELKTAASSAERSIRDLLVGVDHLRVLAAALESMDRPSAKHGQNHVDEDHDDDNN